MWQRLAEELDTLLDSSDNPITTLANSAAFLFPAIGRINWLGFYLYDGTKLYLGPFAGKPACTSIELGKGVCGTSAEKREVIVVDDVEQFPGHIACDPDSSSEIVIPLILSNGSLFGVFDIDSAEIARFGQEEKDGLIEIAGIIARKIG
ncbi:MAG: GAF domain-containing protein [Ignavibacteriota bacterium]